MNILFRRQANGTVDEVGARLEKAAAAHQFGALGVIDLKEKMAAKGVDFGPRLRIYEVCNPKMAKRVLEKNLNISTVLPCRISVFEEAGQVHLATLLPTETLGLFGSPDLIPVADEVESHIRAMVDEAVGSA